MFLAVEHVPSSRVTGVGAWDGENSDHREPKALASGLERWLIVQSLPVASAIGSLFTVPAVV